MTAPGPHWRWAGIPALLVVWMLLASRLPAYVLPQPWGVAAEAARWLQGGKLWPQLAASLVEEAAGFALASIAALAAGLAAGMSRPVRDAVTPIHALFMSIPPVAWAPLTMIVFGLGMGAIVAVIFVASFFPMAIAIQQGVAGLAAGEVRAARTLGATRAQVLVHVVLPASLPAITAALRIGFSQAWRALVAAEMIGATRGIGWMVSMGGQVGNAEQVLLGMVLIGLVAWLMESLVFRRLERHYQRWSAR
jgi:NitT/TauT family transport system permease protein/taurine transport system permease protein